MRLPNSRVYLRSEENHWKVLGYIAAKRGQLS